MVKVPHRPPAGPVLLLAEEKIPPSTSSQRPSAATETTQAVGCLDRERWVVLVQKIPYVDRYISYIILSVVYQLYISYMSVIYVIYQLYIYISS